MFFLHCRFCECDKERVGGERPRFELRMKLGRDKKGMRGDLDDLDEIPLGINAGKHKTILTQTFGVKLVSEKTVDASSSEGRAMIRQYSIAALPTVIISPEAEAYADLITAWKGVGSVEKDGWLVFRKMDALGQETYKDLKTGTVIRPASASASSTGVAAATADDMAGHHP